MINRYRRLLWFKKKSRQGYVWSRVLDMLGKDLKEKEILEDFDPTDRNQNAKRRIN